MYSSRDFFDAATYRTEFYWRQLREHKIQVSEFFQENNFLRIAIHGLNNLGKELYGELDGTGVFVDCFIDKYKRGSIFQTEIIGLEDIGKRDNLDAIVVAPVRAFNQIVDDLLVNGVDINKIVHIDDVIFNQVWRYF